MGAKVKSIPSGVRGHASLCKIMNWGAFFGGWGQRSNWGAGKEGMKKGLGGGENRSAMGKKNSFDRQAQKHPEASFKKKRIRAVLVGKEHQSVWSQVDEGIPNHQGSGGMVEVGSLSFARAGQGNGRETRWLDRDFSCRLPSKGMAVPVMVAVGPDDLNRSLGRR